MSGDDATTDPDLAMVRQVRREFEELLEESRDYPFPITSKLRLAYELGQSAAMYMQYYREKVNRHE